MKSILSERPGWVRIAALVGLPLLALVLTAAAGYLKWEHDSLAASRNAATESVRAASDATVKMLSYKPETVEQELNAAKDDLVGGFRDEYSSLIKDVVIPGSREKHISAVATVPGASSVSADRDHAVVLVFVDQSTTIGTDPPTDTASSVKVSLDRVDDRWLVSGFEPI